MPFDPSQLVYDFSVLTKAGELLHLPHAGLVVEETHGVRVVADLLPAAVVEADPQALLDLEFRWILPESAIPG